MDDNLASRRGSFGKMAGGMVGVVSDGQLGDADFDLDVRLSPAISPQQMVVGDPTDSTCPNQGTCSSSCQGPSVCGTCGSCDTCRTNCRPGCR